MSQLSVFRPGDAPADVPRILSFARYAARIKANELFDVVSRAKLEHANQTCPRCGRVTVESVEKPDPILNRNGAVIPKSATLVGFFCNACGHGWGR